MDVDICRSPIVGAVVHAHSAARVKGTPHSGSSLVKAMKARINNCRTICAGAAKAIASIRG